MLIIDTTGADVLAVALPFVVAGINFIAYRHRREGNPNRTADRYATLVRQRQGSGNEMKMPPEILTLLLRGGHLNVEERKAKGLWPNETLRYSEVLSHLTAIIQQEDRPGDLVYEGTVIQRVSPTRFTCRSRRPSVCDLRTIAEESSKDFRNANDAAAFYLKWELNLPGRLDSWPVV